MAQAPKKHNKIHTIVRGDTLYNLVVRYYGGPWNKNYYIEKICNYNHIPNANEIKIGQKITIPNVPNDFHGFAYYKRIQALKSNHRFKIPNPPHDKREHWMMLVVWIVIHEFNCKVVGGFVRDFIIRGEHPNDIDIVLPKNVGIEGFAVKMYKRMKDIGVIFEKNDKRNSIKGQIFKLSWSKLPLFDADFVPSNAFANGTFCDVDVSNLQLKKFAKGGEVKLCQRVHIKQNITSIVDHICMKQCVVVSNVWQNDQHQKEKLIDRLKDKYEHRGWHILNKQQMCNQGLKW